MPVKTRPSSKSIYAENQEEGLKKIERRRFISLLLRIFCVELQMLTFVELFRGFRVRNLYGSSILSGVTDDRNYLKGFNILKIRLGLYIKILDLK